MFVSQVCLPSTVIALTSYEGSCRGGKVGGCFVNIEVGKAAKACVPTSIKTPTFSGWVALRTPKEKRFRHDTNFAN